ncbi:leucine--tRNA ligase [Culturomica massiliensis]|jgi:leucyl-tRNA synthetase|uniref:leucine--tRNA ligase n=1 Tax=Culturomica massiliensis TaxID=1841857 RepID=UPI000E55B3F5|nr:MULTISPECIES: leucine--tRNA ligase [Odoribacteraceae]RHV90672.1 leucine--tRNA ligase [Odoribacter sp. OF09-27XD]
MEYNFKEVEKKWQSYWKEHKTYQVDTDPAKPKYYVLDMFPYPSGAGLHVGHPLGYIASDIYSRYKRLKGFNVLHPMGYDAYGLPAEQYAIQTGQHPAITTDKNIARYREQLDKIGFSFDWNREIRTCDPHYYKWTQWAFIQMFNSFYCNDEQKAMPIAELVKAFESTGTEGLNVACGENLQFTAEEWKTKTEKEQQEILLNYRLAYLAETMVNWCPQLGTVLANDEVKEGLSVRGGYPVVQKKMRQWSLRVSAYAQRLLDGLDRINWSDSLKDIQRNWIGRSQGADIIFDVKNNDLKLQVFTTRPDTIFGVSFMVLAPESDYVKQLTTPAQQQAVNEYLDYVAKRTERERQSEVKKVTGVFTGSYAVNPFTQQAIPVWISEYVLAGYGTGAIMAVPAHDSRDYAFARKFNLPIVPVIDNGQPIDLSESSYDAKEGKMINSGVINGMEVKEAIKYIAEDVEKREIGKSKINYRLRDAIFSRQRYWGEPFPVYYKDDMPYMLDESKLPLELPEIDKYLPTETGEPPLGRAQNWQTEEGYPLELNTMPGFAGSSAYYLRYMDPHNDKALVSKEANEYWKNVDLYLGGAEHATGHLIYSRFWNHFLYDLGYVCESEPFKKLINQGMIQGRSNFVYRIQGTNKFVSYGLKDQYETTEIHVNVNIVHNDVLDQEAFRNWMPEYANAEFILEDGKYICGWAVEKMSKSMYNVVNPDDIIEEFGADTLRLYEMFLGPLEAHKPWDTQGIDGVFKFLKKFWRLYVNDDKLIITDEEPTKEELKTLHKTIKKIESDIENFSFNTSIPAFMICTNELTGLKCSKRAILEPLVITIAPFAPHIAEELWHKLGHADSVTTAVFPEWNEKFLVEDSFEYPVSFNGKVRFKLALSLAADHAEIEAAVKAAPETAKYLDGKEIRKMIIVPKKIVNIVV